LKVSTNVKIAMQCFENFGGGKCPKCPPPGCAPADYISNCCAHDYSQGVLDSQNIVQKGTSLKKLRTTDIEFLWTTVVLG